MKWNKLKDGDLLMWANTATLPEGIADENTPMLLLIALFDGYVYYRRLGPSSTQWHIINPTDLELQGWKVIGNMDTIYTRICRQC